MDKQITKIQKCILLRQDIEIWIDEEKANQIQTLLAGSFNGRFIKVEDRIVNVADISGIFSARDLEDLKRRKLGQWKCDEGKWHSRTDICNCTEDRKRKEEAEKQARKIAESEITPEQAKKNREEIEKMEQELISKKTF